MSLLLALDLVGVFAFAVDGALTAVRAARLDLFGVITLGMITALGGGIVRDILLGDLPPATFSDYRYLLVAASGGLVAFTWRLERLASAMTVLDAAGLGLFAVTGASKALEFGLGPLQAVILGGITGVGGGTLRDMFIARVPTILTTGLYAVPALLGATITVVADQLGVWSAPAAVVAALACFSLRMAGVRWDWHAPRAIGWQD
ncbi:putative membrane protein YeiH [Motilibacter peucedani]|uniref:Putative membrane protein YeiH n=1 Tax=Motilibacter peucedani TaxID=598650 RepID=A0A420XQ84_9ACTN|nr:TRIC cation channel family protein [Motilibacter peucedani]RKS75419.1 putative membrane protein YeiH [Motilibacter peucedani]